MMGREPTRFSELPLRANYLAHEDRLNDFYVPVLKLAVSYDRLVGYWRSSSLSAAAAGIAHFIQNAMAEGGRMRVIAGVELNDVDIEAIVDGEPLEDAVARRLMDEPEFGVDVVAEDRLRLLAWMVQQGLLEIKVGVPTDADGRPLRPAETDRIFHTKYGILTDTHGDRIAFQGSVNESAMGWIHNHEAFTAYKSWIPTVWEEYGRHWEIDFEDHWSDGQLLPGWVILDLPDAVKAGLVSRVPDDWIPPVIDPEEGTTEAAAELARLAAAPRVIPGLGFSTLPFEPWPHQIQIASRIVDTWPRSYLLADEVGLGKTIEAGMVVRELLLSGRAEKILLLVPASVQRQWQEELWEKFCLDVPSYQSRKFWDHAGDQVSGDNNAAWAAHPVILASSHLARRRSEREAVLEAGPWDLVLVDEAHHARRRGIAGKEGANQLLQLLREMRDAEMWKALVLASATPMQMNTHEIVDLLDVLGLPEEWNSDAAFDSYYRQLAEPDPKAREWKQIRAMLSDYLGQSDVEPNPVVTNRVNKLPGPSRMRIKDFHKLQLPASQIAGLDADERDLLDQWLRGNTPIRDRVFRTTRVALREYQRQGLLSADATIPHRHVSDEMIDFASDEEHRLYDRVEAYISKYYQKYDREKKTKPLGFIMTVYRRRLTSSFAAIHKSLSRRLATIEQKVSVDELLDDDDRFALENMAQIDFDELSSEAKPYAEELEELRSFISDLEAVIPHDTKGKRASTAIRNAFLGGHRSVVVFTQFTDTLDWLADQLKETYGDLIASYTGKGGRRWDDGSKSWIPLSKEEVKELFRAGDVKVLLGTDAMSEGLNLQTCDRLINYDMPWNFMRVEQRIGRIDRINGQPDVYITNYFYNGTVEEQVYSGIAQDADWFKQVVGPAQPVLGEVESVIQKLAMQSPGAARDQAVHDELDLVRQAIIDYQDKPVTLGTLEADDEILTFVGPASELSLEDIEATLIANALTAPLMHPHPDFDRTYFVEVNGAKHAMTFDRTVYDQNPEIGFMTYGHPVFDALLAVV